MSNAQEKRVNRIAELKGFRLERAGHGKGHGRFYIMDLAEGGRMRSGIPDHEYSFSLTNLTPFLRVCDAQTTSDEANARCSRAFGAERKKFAKSTTCWLGCRDSNLGMAEVAYWLAGPPLRSPPAEPGNPSTLPRPTGSLPAIRGLAGQERICRHGSCHFFARTGFKRSRTPIASPFVNSMPSDSRALTTPVIVSRPLVSGLAPRFSMALIEFV